MNKERILEAASFEDDIKRLEFIDKLQVSPEPHEKDITNPSSAARKIPETGNKLRSGAGQENGGFKSLARSDWGDEVDHEVNDKIKRFLQFDDDDDDSDDSWSMLAEQKNDDDGLMDLDLEKMDGENSKDQLELDNGQFGENFGDSDNDDKGKPEVVKPRPEKDKKVGDNGQKPTTKKTRITENDKGKGLDDKFKMDLKNIIDEIKDKKKHQKKKREKKKREKKKPDQTVEPKQKEIHKDRKRKFFKRHKYSRKKRKKGHKAEVKSKSDQLEFDEKKKKSKGRKKGLRKHDKKSKMKSDKIMKAVEKNSEEHNLKKLKKKNRVRNRCFDEGNEFHQPRCLRYEIKVVVNHKFRNSANEDQYPGHKYNEFEENCLEYEKFEPKKSKCKKKKKFSKSQKHPQQKNKKIIKPKAFPNQTAQICKIFDTIVLNVPITKQLDDMPRDEISTVCFREKIRQEKLVLLAIETSELEKETSDFTKNVDRVNSIIKQNQKTP